MGFRLAYSQMRRAASDSRRFHNVLYGFRGLAEQEVTLQKDAIVTILIKQPSIKLTRLFMLFWKSISAFGTILNTQRDKSYIMLFWIFPQCRQTDPPLEFYTDLRGDSTRSSDQESPWF